MYRLVLFDFDGTILDSDEVIVASFLELYAKFRPDYHPCIEHMLAFSGPPIRQSLAQDFPGENQEMMFQEFVNVSTRNYDKYVKLFPGVEDCLIFLRKSNIPFGLVTSKARQATDYALELTGLTGFFDFVVCADEVSKTKPNPEGIFLSMKHFNITNPKDVLYIGDGQIDFDTAKNAGVDFAFVLWSPRHLKDSDNPTMLIDSFPAFIRSFNHD